MSIATSTRSPAAPLRRLPVPVSDPPYDDELAWMQPRPPIRGRGFDPGSGPDRQDTLELAFLLPSGLPVVPTLGSPERSDCASDESDDPAFAPQPTPRALLPEPHGWAARLVQALVEVLAGDRPASQLVRWTNEDIYLRLQRRAGGGRRVEGHPQPVAVRAVVRSVHVSEPADGVAEACAIVQRGLRATAVALRLEGIDGRWQCTALEL